jgi:hypothetical protein
MSNKTTLLSEIISSIENPKIFLVTDIGSAFEKISRSVYKVKPFNGAITHILVNETLFPMIELNYYFKELNFSLSDFIELLGNPEIHYNFRENYTEFKFNSNFERIKKIYLIKDNKIDFYENGVFREKTPRGEERLIRDLQFNLVCLDVVVNNQEH